MEQYLGELCGATKSVLMEGLKAYAKYLDDLTGLGSALKNQSEEDIKNTLDAFFHLFDLNDRTNIAVNGHKLLKICEEISSIKKKGDSLKFSDLKAAADNMRQIGSLSLEDIRDKVTQDVVTNINKSLSDYLNSAIFDPEKTPTESAEEIQKALVEDIRKQYPAESGIIEWVMNRVGLRCPVNFHVYNSENQCIGYVENGEVWYESPIYILVEGDCKDVFLPGGMDVRFEFTGTGQGEMTYVMEEVRNGETIGRRNYYDIPLTEGISYTQSFRTGDDLQNLQADALTTADGNTIGGSEYLDAWDEASDSGIYIDCVAEIGGTATGAGNFVKGDAVTLDAIPDEAYEFVGWYVDEVLVSAESPYQFAALESQEVHARFRVPYQESERFDVSMGTRYRNMVAAVYEDSEGLSRIELHQVGLKNTAMFTAVNIKLYGANHTLYSDRTLTTDYDLKNGYWLPAIDLKNCAKVELYDQSGNGIATLFSSEWSEIEPITLHCQALSTTENSASFQATISNPGNASISGKLAAAAYSGGRMLDCIVLDINVAASSDTEKTLTLTWQGEASSITEKFFFLDDSWMPLASARVNCKNERDCIPAHFY